MGTSAQVARELEFDGIHCALAIRKFLNGTVVLKISGTDVGEFGERPMLELQECVRDIEPVHLFIDARDVRGASMNVSGAWDEWLGNHRLHFGTISMLTGSRYVEITADFVRRFSALEGIMRIYTEPEIFDAVLNQAIC